MPAQRRHKDDQRIPITVPTPASSRRKPLPIPVNTALRSSRVSTSKTSTEQLQPSAQIPAEKLGQKAPITQARSQISRPSRTPQTSTPTDQQSQHSPSPQTPSPDGTPSIPAKRKGRAKDEHPWKKSGVGRSQQEITAEATLKRNEIRAKAAAKAEREQQKKAQHDTGEKTLGALMTGRERLMKELDEADAVPDESEIESDYIPDAPSELDVTSSDSYEEVVVRQKVCVNIHRHLMNAAEACTSRNRS